MGYQLADALIGAYGAAQANKRQEQEARLSQERQKQEDILKNDYQVAQREAAAGRPDIMQLGFPEQYQAQQIAAQDKQRQLQSGQIKDAETIQGMRQLPPLVYEIAAQYGLGKGDEQAILKDTRIGADIQKHFKAGLEGRAKGTGNVIMPGGGQSLSTPVQTAQQTAVLQARQKKDMLNSLDLAIDKVGKGGTGSLLNRGQAWLTDKKSKAGISISKEEEQTLANYTDAVAQMGNLVNQTIKEMSGANVPPTEMQRMAQSLMLPTDSAIVNAAKRKAFRANLDLIEKNGIESIGRGVSLVVPDDFINKDKQQSTPDLQLPQGWTVVE